ncbi:jun dimerization protein 2-like isoform X2 [Ptychodera flava]|uniref:jun dimerization protein 2-like isoform X2 n=1 Tax=Ptychodera flava TaxID=63121 RepID=UPI00396A8577
MTDIVLQGTTTSPILSEDDRLQLRRLKNRQAAAKCRNRKKDKIEALLKEVDRLSLKNKNLQSLVQRLQTEEEELVLLLRSHLMRCKYATHYVKV